jgi:hypothetical protein
MHPDSIYLFLLFSSHLSLSMTHVSHLLHDIRANIFEAGSRLTGLPSSSWLVTRISKLFFSSSSNPDASPITLYSSLLSKSYTVKFAYISLSHTHSTMVDYPRHTMTGMLRALRLVTLLYDTMDYVQYFCLRPSMFYWFPIELCSLGCGLFLIQKNYQIDRSVCKLVYTSGQRNS